jgi:hypothetical protein
MLTMCCHSFPLSDRRRTSLWQFDLLEVARQWTLLDHAVFCSVSPAGLAAAGCSWMDPRHCELGGRGGGGGGGGGGSARRPIDRFNAQSTWVTCAVLGPESPRERAEVYANFVQLADFMEQLNNYSGCMSILSALQQACICRLKDTLQLVTEQSKQTLARLQVIGSSLDIFQLF